MNESDFEILLVSASDYEKLTVEIFYKGKFIALLNQDEGVDNLKIELSGENVDEDMVLRKIDLDVFLTGVELAKQKIIKGV